MSAAIVGGTIQSASPITSAARSPTPSPRPRRRPARAAAAPAAAGPRAAEGAGGRGGERSGNSPTLVDVALPIELGDLQGGAVGLVGCLDEIGSNLDRHLLLIGTVGESLPQGASVEAVKVTLLVEIHQRQERRSEVHIARRRAHDDAALEISAP